MSSNALTRLSLATAVALSLASPAGALGNDRAFLTIPGYTRTTTDTAMSSTPGAMDIKSWEFHIDRQASGTGAGATSKARLSSVTITKPVDVNSVALTRDALSGALLTSAAITIRTAPNGLMRYCLSGVMVSGYDIANSAGAQDLETFELQASQFVTSFSPAATAAVAPVKTGFNFTLSKVLIGKPLSDC